MKELKDYLIGLLRSADASKQILDIEPYFKVFTNPESFVYDPEYLYYGVFNIATEGQIDLSLFGSDTLRFEAGDVGITQPVLFDSLLPFSAAFTGVRIKIF